jgi:hypothetical protein
MAVMFFFLIRNLIHRLATWNIDFILPTFALATAIALLFLRVSYDGLGSIYKILARSTAAGLIAYLVLEPPSFTLADQAYMHVAAYVDIAYWVALILTTLGLWRPSFLFPAGFYVISTRYAANEISGFPISVLDIRYMIEMAQFLAIGACAVALLRRVVGRWSEHTWTAPLRLLDLDTLSLCLAFSAIGFHLGNYFWSGIRKLLMGPNLLT